MSDTKPVEQATAYVLPAPGENGVVGAPTRQVAVEPTQMRRPWQATIRTAFQSLVALATLVPLILADVYESPDAYPAAVTQVVLIAGLVSRIMAMPGVEEFLRNFLPFLAAAPPPRPDNEGGAIGLLYAGAILAVLGLILWLATVYDTIGVILLGVGVVMVVLAAVRRDRV